MSRTELELPSCSDLPTRLELPSWVEAVLLPLARRVVPANRRAEWTREWQAELWHLRHGQQANSLAGSKVKTNAWAGASLARGLLADAAWLRCDWWRQTAPGSAEWCLAMLTGACLVMAGIDGVIAGSWHGLTLMLAVHFMRSFAFIAAPATFAAMVTYPMKELRWERKDSRGWFSARARWNGFFAAKIALTLMLGFLTTVAMSAPLRSSIGFFADWFELIAAAVLVSFGLRWAMLNQERRCQRCLRLLRPPTRVGPPSHNFLEWSGTALACSDGHGLLQVPAMQGSWCWYDRWVELDPAWSEAAYS
jgi:hypothetical protein